MKTHTSSRADAAALLAAAALGLTACGGSDSSDDKGKIDGVQKASKSASASVPSVNR